MLAALQSKKPEQASVIFGKAFDKFSKYIVAGLLSVQRVLGALDYGSRTDDVDVVRIQHAVNKVHGNYGRLLVDLVKMVNCQHELAMKNGAGSSE